MRAGTPMASPRQGPAARRRPRRPATMFQAHRVMANDGGIFAQPGSICRDDRRNEDGVGRSWRPASAKPATSPWLMPTYR